MRPLIYCPLYPFLGLLASQYSSWLIVCMTIERYLVIRFPLHTKRWLTVVNARWICLGFLLVLVLINLHFFFTMTSEVDWMNCKSSSSKSLKYFVELIWPWIHLAIYMGLPMLLLCIFNILLVVSLVQWSCVLSFY